MLNRLLSMFMASSDGSKPFERQESIGNSVVQLIRYVRGPEEDRTPTKDKLAIDALRNIARDIEQKKNKEKEASHVL